jgi:hypothetical protein
MPPTTISPGDVVVPMSTILDALEGVLTDEEREALFAELVNLSPGAVAPGDLITAQLFNTMREDINDIAIRLSALEGEAGGPILESLTPSSTVAINGLLIVRGRNFDPIRSQNTVSIGEVDVTQFRPDSTATSLIFPVPDLFTGLPKTLPVRVSAGGRTSNALSITVQPQDQVQQGNFSVGSGVATAGTITIGQAIAITWPVQALTTLPDSVALEVLAGAVNGASASAWLASVAFTPPSPMSILAGQTKPVRADLTVPGGATSVQLSLRVTSGDGAIVNTSDPVTIEVGSAIETSDPRIDITYTLGALSSGGMVRGKVTIDGVEADGLLVKKGQNGVVKFHAVDTRSSGSNTNFAVSAEIVAPANGLTVSGGPNPAASPAGGIASGGDLPFDLPLSAPSGATTGATARLKVTVNQTKTSSGLTAYKAFKLIPLRKVD